MKLFCPALILAMATLVACDRTYITNPIQPAPTTPVTTPAITTSTIQFRVTGNANSVRIKYVTERDGQVQVTTNLPFFTSFNTTADTLFLSIDVTPISYTVLQFPFLSVQIFVNGNLFREASSNEFTLNTISVNGIWRK